MMQVGERVRLSGGYEPDPEWLAGKGVVAGTIEEFIPGQNSGEAMVVRLDQEIHAEGVTGSIVVLELRYVGAAWTSKETVHVELCDFKPEPKPWQQRRKGKWIESHATVTKI